MSLVLLLLAGAGAVLFGPQEPVREAEGDRARIEVDELPVAELLPPERRRIWLEPARFSLEPVRDPLDGSGGGRDIRESLEEVETPPLSHAPGGRRVRVRPGDTLTAIARRELGDARRWREIATLNRLADPDQLEPGSLLRLPGEASPGERPAAETEAEAGAPAAGAREYEVQAGDTLGELAARFYGSSRLAGWLARANGLDDPSRLQAGQRLRLPAAPAAGGPQPQAAGDGERFHVVQPGESLGAISQRLYGTVRDWRRIAEANGIRDPSSLRAGQRLRIPQRP